MADAAPRLRTLHLEDEPNDREASAGRERYRGSSDVAEHLTPLDRWRHDLKNQLGIVLGFSDLLLNELEPGSTYQPDVVEIYAAAQRALDLLARMPHGPATRSEKGEHSPHAPRGAVSE